TFHRTGPLPSWSKDIASGNKLTNARAEPAPEKPSFRAAFRRRPCLTPTNGSYECQTANGAKRPHFSDPRGEPVFAFAGLWEIWYSPDGDELRTCTILTTAANDLLRPLHERMPVILKRENYADWLEPGEAPIEALIPLMKPYDPDKMALYEVSRMV